MTFAYCCVMGLNYRITSPHSTFCWVAQTIFQTCRQTVDFDFWLDEISTLAGNFSVWWRGKHTHNICISMGNHPILVCGFQWLFDVQPYFWDELPQKKGFSTVFSWDIFGRGRDMVFLYHNPLDSDGQLGRFQLEQISQTLGSWWQPVISGTRVSPCSKMFKVLSARVCRNFRPFFCGYEHVWSGLQWNPVFFGDQSDQKNWLLHLPWKKCGWSPAKAGTIDDFEKHLRPPWRIRMQPSIPRFFGGSPSA